MARTMQLLIACLALVWIHGLSLVEAGRQRYAVLHAGDEAMLQGTWSSGSGKVVTGAGFFNPRARSFTPPTVPGLAYSFTRDGYWEFAKYRVQPNRKYVYRSRQLASWSDLLIWSPNLGSHSHSEKTRVYSKPIDLATRQLHPPHQWHSSALAYHTRRCSASYLELPRRQSTRRDVRRFGRVHHGRHLD